MRSTTKRRLALCSVVSEARKSASSVRSMVRQQALVHALQIGLGSTEPQAPLRAGFLLQGFGDEPAEQTAGATNLGPFRRSGDE